MLNDEILAVFQEPYKINFEKLDDKIFIYHGMIENPNLLVQKIEDLDAECFEDTPINKWQDWTASGDSEENKYIFGKQKQINHETIEDFKDTLFYNIYEEISGAINFSSEHYGYVNNIQIGKVSPISISKYQTGSFMGPHVDSYENDPTTTISVVCYLNDNYEGGELYFKEQGIEVKPKAGDIVVFPSHEPYYHESKPVISGTKYMSPGFWFNR
jgi:Rps23 Pro-64 3,4-dihydroxylase Tpa1-like proline 4-hydroxylase